jgi:hypothetical protein
MTNTSDDAWTAIAISDTIRNAIAGRPPAVQSAVLADLLALWVVGHHPALRETMLKDHFDLVVNLLPLAEWQLFGADGHPGHKDMVRD